MDVPGVSRTTVTFIMTAQTCQKYELRLGVVASLKIDGIGGRRVIFLY